MLVFLLGEFIVIHSIGWRSITTTLKRKKVIHHRAIIYFSCTHFVGLFVLTVLSYSIDVIDNSGLRLYYTDQLRQHDVGILNTGVLPMSPMQYNIPPKATQFHTYSICNTSHFDQVCCFVTGIRNGRHACAHIPATSM